MKGLLRRLSRPQSLARTHLWLTFAFVTLVPVAIVTGWLYSVAFISALSLWALVGAHWSAWQASRVEVIQDEDANVQDVLEEVREMKRLMRALIDAVQGDCEDLDEAQG